VVIGKVKKRQIRVVISVVKKGQLRVVNSGASALARQRSSIAKEIW